MSEKHELPKLYKLTNNGKIQENQIIVFDRGNEAAIKTFRGYVGGKITPDEPTIISEGKNIGKSNETTYLEQALSDAKSKWNKKKDEGYCLSIQETMDNILVLPMLAKRFQDQKKHIKFPCFCQQKFDGCFTANTKISTDIGTIRIGDIVDNKMKINALSYNEITEKFEYKPITNWFYNGFSDSSNWFDITPENGQRKRNTNNHKYFTNLGWVEASELDTGVHRIFDNNYSFRKNCLIAGTLLGDSLMSVDKRASGRSYRLSFSHENEELFEFKKELLGLDGSVIDYVSGYGSNCKRFVSTALTKSDFPIHLFYFTGNLDNCGNRKHLTYDTIKKYITPEALSLWIADDGSIRYNNGNENTPVLQLSTHSHSIEQIDVFVKYFQKVWNCNPSKIVDKRVHISEKTSGIYLNFNTKDTLYLLNQLCKFACKGMEHKYYFLEKIEYIKENKDEFRFVNFTKSKSLFSEKIHKFDIEVGDNHNYVANGTLVHNCRSLTVKMKDGTVSIKSRKGKEFPHLNHLREEAKSFPVGQYVDGELYSDDLTFEQITGIVRSETLSPEKQEMILKIKIRAYDSFKIGIDEDFDVRHSALNNVIAGKEHFTLVQNYIAENEADVRKFHDKFVQDGFEGVMIRNIKGSYEMDKRSNNLQKFKVFIDDEFEIVGYTEGTGNEAGCVVWVCKTKDGQEFSCRPRGIAAQRREWFENGEKYIGKMLTVRFFEYSSDKKIPRFPVGICPRDDI